jgi:hypothetical protein
MRIQATSDPGATSGAWRRANIDVQSDGGSSSGGGTDGLRTAWTSAFGSSTWKDAVIVRTTPTAWRAVMRRLAKDRPSRTRSTSNRIFSPCAPDRRNEACSEWAWNSSDTVAAAARRPWATIWPPYRPPHG